MAARKNEPEIYAMLHVCKDDTAECLPYIRLTLFFSSVLKYVLTIEIIKIHATVDGRTWEGEKAAEAQIRCDATSFPFPFNDIHDHEAVGNRNFSSTLLKIY